MAMSHRPGDFRDRAVIESMRLLREVAIAQRSAVRDPLLAGVSYCLSAGRNFRKIEPWIVVLDFFCAILGIVFLVATMILIYLIERLSNHVGASNGLLVLSATMVSAALTGMCFFGGPWATNLLAKSHINGRLRDADKPPLDQCEGVTVAEDKPTRANAAPTTDRALLVCHEAPRFVQIEGLSHRYVIWPEDVVLLRSDVSPEGEYVVLAYRIGEVNVSLTLTPEKPGGFLMRYFLHRDSGLHNRLMHTLATPASKTRADELTAGSDP